VCRLTLPHQTSKETQCRVGRPAGWLGLAFYFFAGPNTTGRQGMDGRWSCTTLMMQAGAGGGSNAAEYTSNSIHRAAYAPPMHIREIDGPIERSNFCCLPV